MQTNNGLKPDVAAAERVKVLYISGWGRSGSTILGGILGQIEGFSLLGEIRHIWDRGLIENSLCSCGLTFHDCPVWQEILTKAFGSADRIESEKLFGYLNHGLRTKHFLLPPPYPRPAKRVAEMHEYTEALSKLYRAALSVTESRVLVDTSKVPAYAYILDNIEDIDLYVLHLVRDPRATAYSWASRRKLQPDSKGESSPMIGHGSIHNSLVWNEWNFVIERLWRNDPTRYMRLRYEDFVGKPRTTVESIIAFLGEREARLPFVGDREVSLGESHVFSGNPNRFDKGSVAIKADEEWKRKIDSRQSALVTSFTYPGLRYYNYPIMTRDSKKGQPQGDG